MCAGIDKGEYAALMDWCRQKHLKIKNFKTSEQIEAENAAGPLSKAVTKASMQQSDDEEPGTDACTRCIQFTLYTTSCQMQTDFRCEGMLAVTC